MSVEAGLFIRFIAIPIAKLFRLADGIDYKKASSIIGNHFPEVSDKLLNLLQLKENKESSSLLLASIEQKSKALKPVPFKLAISFKNNVKYLKYAAIPIAIFLILVAFNKTSWISNSYERVVNYKVAYEPPAPFQFFIVNKNLNAFENKDYVLKVRTVGDVFPDNATINYNNEVYFLKNTGVGEFEYVFIQLKKPIEFTISANDISSKPYTLDVVPIPALLDFEMKLDYPSYTRKKDEVLKSSGNAIVPEGTKVTWLVNTRNTDKVEFKTKDTVVSLIQENTEFSYSDKVFSDLYYEITTSNKNVENYDNVSFNLHVVRDQYPEMNLKSEKDTIDNQTIYFFGRVSDDYGISTLQLVYYNQNKPEDKVKKNLAINQALFDEFIYAFPDNLNLEPGVNYEFYFEVFDNDVIHSYKSTKSQVFDFRKLTKEEQESKLLQKQSETISGLNKSLDKFKEQEQELKSLSKLQKEKKRLDFNDKKKLEDFLKRQKEQEKMMQDFSKKLKENLNQFEDKEEEPFKDALKERLERNEERLKKNEKLLEEIEKLTDKIQKEELTKKLDQLKKENKNLKKNLEQLLELTKRYYVIEKHEKLVEKLNDLSEKQEELSKKNEENTKEKQEELNKEFDDFQKQMEELKKQNDDLKKPMDIDQKKEDEVEIKKEQEKATDNLDKQNKTEAKKNQKSAAQKMKQMSKGMQMQMQMAGGEQQQEDMEMLRQVLDNLVDFSIEQEGLMKEFKKIDIDNPSYSSKLKRQSVLRENFIHVDDSLYALALRTPQITESVTQKLTDIEFNIDKSLERLAENQVVQGAANQQYTVTGSNDLAYLLSRTLDQMQNSMSASGKGKGGSNEFQLPDIIKKQEELNEKMEKGMEKGEKEGQQKGEKNEGDNGEQKESKDKGQNGKNKSNQGEGEDGESDQQREDLNGELYEIFKQQQELRNALSDRINKEKKGQGIGNNLLKKMQEVEEELLEKGFNERTLGKMLELKHELLKLEDAALEQGEEEKRESTTNQEQFENANQNRLDKAKQYFNTTEILNRQVLPLRQNYKRKVQEYFKKNND
ncbi:ATPase [Aquimarina mytili]